jgi:hypothetical protein
MTSYTLHWERGPTCLFPDMDLWRVRDGKGYHVTFLWWPTGQRPDYH